MKTTCIFLKTKKLLPMMLVAALGLLILCCTKDEDEPRVNPNMGVAWDEIVQESYAITPDGKNISALKGALEIDFPEGVVNARTNIIIFSYPLNQVNYDKHNMMKRGFGIEIIGEQIELLESATLRMKYDLNEFMQGEPESEQSLTIYQVCPDIYNPEYIVPLSECCIDGSCKMISSCFERGGNFIVGVN